MEVKVEAEQVAKIRNLRRFSTSKILQPAKFLQWSKFLQLMAQISFRLMTRTFEFGSYSSCLSRLEDVGLFSLYNYKNSHKMR